LTSVKFVEFEDQHGGVSDVRPAPVAERSLDSLHEEGAVRWACRLVVQCLISGSSTLACAVGRSQGSALK
jgi:hypothetical protein